MREHHNSPNFGIFNSKENFMEKLTKFSDFMKIQNKKRSEQSLFNYNLQNNKINYRQQQNTNFLTFPVLYANKKQPKVQNERDNRFSDNYFHRYPKRNKQMQKLKEIDNQLERLLFDQDQTNKREKKQWQRRMQEQLKEQKKLIIQIGTNIKNSFYDRQSNYQFMQQPRMKPMGVLYSQANVLYDNSMQRQRQQQGIYNNNGLLNNKRNPFVFNPHSKAIKKFRIAVYCVIFVNYFPKYVRRFTQQRYLHFKKYQEKYHKQLDDSLIQIVVNLKIFDQLIPQQVQHTQKSSEDDQQEEDSQEQKILEFQLQLDKLQEFAILFLKQITLKIEQLPKQFSKLALFSFQGSFCLDNFYILQELYRLNIHKTKNYLNINKQQTTSLIIIHLLIKIIVFKIFMNQKRNPILNSFIYKKVANKNQKQAYVNFFWRRLYIVGFFIYQLSMELFQETFQNQVGNINQIALNTIMLPMKPLFLEIADQEKKKAKKTVTINADFDQISKELYKQINFQEYDFIENIFDQQGDISAAIQYLALNSKLADEIQIFAQKTYFYVFKARKALYEDIKQKMKYQSKNFKQIQSFTFQRYDQSIVQMVQQVLKKNIKRK